MQNDVMMGMGETRPQEIPAGVPRSGSIKIHGEAAFEGMRKAGRLAATCLSLEALDVPVIAKVGGTAVAAGFELALACDLIVIADDALIGDGHVAAGVVPAISKARAAAPRTGESSRSGIEVISSS